MQYHVLIAGRTEAGDRITFVMENITAECPRHAIQMASIRHERDIDWYETGAANQPQRRNDVTALSYEVLQ